MKIVIVGGGANIRPSCIISTSNVILGSGCVIQLSIVDESHPSKKV